MTNIQLSYDPYGPASFFFSKPLMKVPYEGRTRRRKRAEKRRPALRALRTALR